MTGHTATEWKELVGDFDFHEGLRQEIEEGRLYLRLFLVADAKPVRHNVSKQCALEDALWGLLHDASEAYLCDIPRPLKIRKEFAAYREVERRLLQVIVVRFGLSSEQPASVTEADDTMLWIEAHSLLGSIPDEAIRETRAPFEITDPLLPAERERVFLERFKETRRTADWRSDPLG
jgi:hypothetical protein